MRKWTIPSFLRSPFSIVIASAFLVLAFQNCMQTGSNQNSSTQNSESDSTRTQTPTEIPLCDGEGVVAKATRLSYFKWSNLSHVFIPDSGNNVIRKVNGVSGVISTFAGHSMGFAGDNGPASSASFSSPSSMVFDSYGNLFIADYANNVVRKIGTTGFVTTVAGKPGMSGYSGDGGLATSALLSNPSDVAVDSAGNLFIADSYNSVIRKVELKTGVISTVAGKGTYSGNSGDEGPARSALLTWPNFIAIDGVGNLFISDAGAHVIRKVDFSTNKISTVAGNGHAGFSGDGGPAAAAQLSAPFGLVLDACGNIFVADSGNNAIRKIDTGSETISTFAGASSGGGSVAINTSFNAPYELAFDNSGHLLVSEALRSSVKKISLLNRTISDYAGTGVSGYSGDNGPANLALLNLSESRNDQASNPPHPAPEPAPVPAPLPPTPAPAPMPLPKIFSWTLVMSSQYGSPVPSLAALQDNDGTTGAGTGSTGNEWIELDASSPFTSKSVTIGQLDPSAPGGWGAVYGNTAKFQYFDGTSWIDLITVNGLVDYASPVTFTYPAVTATKFRLIKASSWLGIGKFIINP